jgi:glycosyltransferase involved in cell wall biosynthesis
MRILHVPYSYHPDPAGGTEIYVEGLAECQRQAGYELAIAAPGTDSCHYVHAGIPVWRFAVSPRPSLNEIYGEGDKIAAKHFGIILEEFDPELIHLHAFTGAVSVRLADEAARRGIPVVLNYHTPTVSCVRGTLLKWGSEICDGKLDRTACASCVLQANGLPRPLARALAAVPRPASHLIEHAGLSGGPWTALRMPQLIDLRIRSFERLAGAVDRIIALCDWTRELLLRNGIPSEKIVVNRQGIRWNPEAFPAASPRSAALPLRAVFLGRFDRTKGAHVVVQALRNNPGLQIHLDLFGISQGQANDKYTADLRLLIADDPRIRLLPPIPSETVIENLRRYDFLVVPSQWLETGPLVVLEAFAALTPVVGSNLGGIAELVTSGVDGLLIDSFDSAGAWAATLKKLDAEPVVINSLRAGIRPPRHTRQAAADFIPLYEELGRRKGAPALA